MFGIGFTEIIIIGIIALLVVGPDKLPEAATKLGRFIWDLRRAWDDVRDSVRTEIMTVKQPFDEIRKAGDQARDAIRKEARDLRDQTAGVLKKEATAAKDALAKPAAQDPETAPAAPVPAASEPAAPAAETVAAGPQPYRRQPPPPAGVTYFDLDGNPVEPPAES